MARGERSPRAQGPARSTLNGTDLVARVKRTRARAWRMALIRRERQLIDLGRSAGRVRRHRVDRHMLCTLLQDWTEHWDAGVRPAGLVVGPLASRPRVVALAASAKTRAATRRGLCGAAALSCGRLSSHCSMRTRWPGRAAGARARTIAPRAVGGVIGPLTHPSSMKPSKYCDRPARSSASGRS